MLSAKYYVNGLLAFCDLNDTNINLGRIRILEFLSQGKT